MPTAEFLTLAPTATLTVRTLGHFSVHRAGRRLTVADWEARKTRDLFKILVARRGRALTRDAAVDALWPDEPAEIADQLLRRLSVALSTLRKVLDPERRFEADHFIAADRRAIRLRLEHVDLDLAAFLDAVQAAELAADAGDWIRAEQLVIEAQGCYVGDFLEEDRFEDWATECRDYVRSAALRAGQLRVDAARHRRDAAALARHLERFLELDPYDEPTWLALVEILRGRRRHGEALRQYRRYAGRMAELGITPSPIPA